MPLNLNDRLGGFPVLQTQRLCLRELRPQEDAPARYAMWSDPEVMQFLPHRPSPSVLADMTIKPRR